MFIISKKNFRVRRADGSPYLIRKDFIGEIPEDVANSTLVRSAIQTGSIATPSGHKDKELRKADEIAKETFCESDIRPDAETKTKAKK